MARGLTMMWQQDCSITEGICRLEWCEDESDTLHHFQPTAFCTKGENDSSHGRGSFVLLLNSSHWEVPGQIALKLGSHRPQWLIIMLRKLSWSCFLSHLLLCSGEKITTVIFSLLSLQPNCLLFSPPLWPLPAYILPWSFLHPPHLVSYLYFHFLSPSPMSSLSTPPYSYPAIFRDHLLPRLATLPPNVQSELSKVVFLFLPLAYPAWWRVII